jgi:hypothetical protein
MTRARESTPGPAVFLPARWAGIGAAVAGLLGGGAGLVVGLGVNPRTAWFAVFEVGMPATVVGALVGLVGGTITLGARRALAPPLRAATGRGARPRPPVTVGPELVVALGAGAELHALWSMEWARRVDALGRATAFTEGPTRLLAYAALASLVLALLIVVSRWHWPRWVLLATTLTAAAGAIMVALSSIAAANTNDARPGLGTITSYRPGTAVGVVAALVIAGAALVGVLRSLGLHDDHRAPRLTAGR